MIRGIISDGFAEIAAVLEAICEKAYNRVWRT